MNASPDKLPANSSSRRKRLLVLTGDHSADAHAAEFIRALRSLEPDDWQIAGVGGIAMQAEPGVEILSNHDQMGVVGIGGVIAAIPSHRALGKKVLDWCDENRPDVAVLIDYGVFHLWLAPKLRARGIKVIYFIPPQIWASRPWRLRKLKCSADEVLVILPFEESYYRKNGIAAEFVGNPLASHLPPASSKAHMAERFGIDASRTLIGLFPGSRKLEIRNLLGPQIAAAKRLNAQFPDRFSVALSRAKNLKASFFDEMLRNAGANDLPWLKIVDDNHALLSASDLVLAASGTLTLEATLYGTPMVVMYRGPWYAYALVKLLMSVDHAALPNNLEEPPGAAPSESDHSDDVRSRRIVPELWQYEVTGERIADEALAVLEPARYSRMKHDIARVARQFHDVQTPLRVARAIVRMARDGQTAPTP